MFMQWPWLSVGKYMEILDVVRESTNDHSLVKKRNHISFMLDANMYKTEGKACYSYVYRWFITCLWSYTRDWFKSTYSFLSIWPSFYISPHLSIHSIPFRVTKSLHSQSLIRLHSLSADNTAALPGCQKHGPTPLLFNYLFHKSHPSSLLKLKSSCLISKQSRVGHCVCVFVCANCVDEVTLPSCNFRAFSTLKCFFSLSGDCNNCSDNPTHALRRNSCNYSSHR